MSKLKGYVPHNKVKIAKVESNFKKWLLWGERKYICDYVVYRKQEVTKYNTKREKNIFTNKWGDVYVPVTYWDWVTVESFKKEAQAIALAVRLREEDVQH